jgi:hypothetical protein
MLRAHRMTPGIDDLREFLALDWLVRERALHLA